ncbi:succinyldiaminopimelate transaminase [Aeromicrobium sp. Leaf350]|uniref:succinyldiaminopimelate transaminase n=1 Tax=Aeromicrobium sp. Leaf350 TaxID=2876565 RepID=UPI001E428202|nr:succinyldiaminopimelate transaminase [Aeromicrobium sp. Leaf350]
MSRVSARFPEFPWDTLAGAKARAAEHPGGIVDLSIGTPVDPVPDVAREALLAAVDAHGYPTVAGPDQVRDTIARWVTRATGAPQLTRDQVLMSIGSKELIANLPTQLGLGAGDLVVYPELAYPTYEVGARYAGCEVLAADSTVAIGPRTPKLLYLNSPGNPSGRILGVDHLRKVVAWARERGVLVVSDECYLDFAWDAPAVSVLHPDVSGGDLTGLIALHSTSKRSNLAGYRAAFLSGDPAVVGELLAVRKHLGFMVPTPVQQALAATLADDAHVAEQRERYARRRLLLRAALEGAGFTIDHSEGALYLWATRGEPCRDTIAWLAEHGILAAPGEFYGPAGAQHVRVAFTATDERIDAAAQRLTA